MSERTPPTQKREDYLSIALVLVVVVVSASIYMVASPEWQSWFVTIVR